MLGVFDFAPTHEIFRISEIRDDAVMATGGAKDLGLLGRHQPVADVVLGVGAEPVELALPGKRPPAAVSLFQCGDGFLMRQIAQAQAAAFALCILEVERLTAILAFKKLHGRIADRCRRYQRAEDWRTRVKAASVMRGAASGGR